jgi:LiaF transmembrane domain
MDEDETLTPPALPPAPAPPPAPSPEPGVDFAKLGWGVALAAFGVLLLLDRFDVLYVERFWRLWPLILVVLGAATLAGARTPGRRRSALWLLGIGVWLLVNTFEIGGFWWNDSWPLVVILAGVIAMVQPRCGHSRYRGLWLLAIGVWLLVNVLGIGGFYWDDSWPLLLVALGALMVVRALTDQGWGRWGRGRRAAEGGEHEP